MRDRYADACTTNLQSTPTYFPGEEKKLITMEGGSLAPRNATNYESCYFIFETDLNVWRTDARKVIWVESIENMDFFVFKGSDRLNTTLMQAQFDESTGVYYYWATSSE